MITRGCAEVVADNSNQLGEGPIWHSQERCLYWVDILADKVYRYDTVKHCVDFVHTPFYPSALVPKASGDFLLAVKEGIGTLSFETGLFTLEYPMGQDFPGTRCNDGKCDPEGRFWIGTMGMDEQAGAGSLYRLEENSGLTKVLGVVTISNGMAWDTSHQRFYHIDTPTRTIVAYEYERTTGAIRQPTTVIQIPADDGWPDGMAIDQEGKLWVALWDGWAVARFDPDTGEKLAEIKLPVSRPTSCAFGGKDLDVLYITSARAGLSADQLAQQPLSGALFATDHIYVKGLDTINFRIKDE
ncbi:SMP-30/gluconolactonase/LRE family protein [Sphingobacterium pedocola]|uniref:Regucalcin n=1 Tax=Sphingobacterium pedocola TaxID=2082722 RepID=A0ABR9TBF6_9SPHI|nr:SMP-30/gluconolactonase/LRE family protein [Sphingobacterium pedocola]MBE8721987.1 SMP-30/gluconolaconase/LRE domain protein [Sphingobacterium pedocola]